MLILITILFFFCVDMFGYMLDICWIYVGYMLDYIPWRGVHLESNGVYLIILYKYPYHINTTYITKILASNHKQNIRKKDKQNPHYTIQYLFTIYIF